MISVFAHGTVTIFSLNCQEGINMPRFVLKVEELKSKLQEMGEDISERINIRNILMSLSNCYKHFISAWVDEQIIHNLLAKLLTENEIIKGGKKQANQKHW